MAKPLFATLKSAKSRYQKTPLLQQCYNPNRTDNHHTCKIDESRRYIDMDDEGENENGDGFHQPKITCKTHTGGYGGVVMP